ncbi:MAG: type III secretion protein [Deltaproteobacteria bacterium]|nr:type III secretion protein [Deltaproteobacteria bacterium]
MSNIGDLGNVFNKGINQLESMDSGLQARIDQITQGGESISQGDYLQLNFQLGQYNAFIESLASLTKSMSDTLKSLAQKTG